VYTTEKTKNISYTRDSEN